MERPKKCSGCGKIFESDYPSSGIFHTNDGCYCADCAAKIPSYVMKKCFQCRYIDYDGLKTPFCRYGRIRYICKTDDACERYESRFSMTDIRY